VTGSCTRSTPGNELQVEDTEYLIVSERELLAVVPEGK
jgi:co-chaperonin GroES (HSP10)